MTKPAKYMDDASADTILGARVYCEDFFDANSNLPKRSSENND